LTAEAFREAMGDMYTTITKAFEEGGADSYPLKVIKSVTKKVFHIFIERT